MCKLLKHGRLREQYETYKKNMMLTLLNMKHIQHSQNKLYIQIKEIINMLKFHQTKL